MPSALNTSRLAVIATLGLGVGLALGADATRPIDYTERNQPYAPNESVAPQKQRPAANDRVQEKRVEKVIVEKQNSTVLKREGPMEVKETRPKEVREKITRRPEVIEHTTSDFNHRPSTFSTAADTSKPPMVAKYQDSLTAASAANMARFPAFDRATNAKINRFVFRKNPPEPAAAVKESSIIPAAGGSVTRK